MNTTYLSNLSMNIGLSSFHAFRPISSFKVNHAVGPGPTSRAPTVNLEATTWWRVRFPPSTESNVALLVRVRSIQILVNLDIL